MRHGDNEWGDIVRWSMNALIAAEEYGITSENIDDLKANSTNPEIRRMLGVEGDLGGMIGLDNEWAYRAIKANGNYAEIFNRYLGPDTQVGLERGLNAQWTQGGLLYAPPFR